ncbi:uncharacterized protein LOC130751873 isoform X1 [Actinidia eriantha]|uniref:uncharacterized protein LOC130751873 isoform X1 n=1 Tax=Actinidia eriantha TaxID=165200 RepID=UPI0025844C25|nr:uncharacterized protein LOC130751873 isoform X1 [Actinidia eriantha]
MSSGSGVSIPSSVRKTIQNIKEIAGNHSEEEIYAMLEECSMDPNETAHKLLLQDTFHEVKRKRDKRKENLSNKESAESRWRPGMQGRGSRAGRGNFSTCYVSNDVSGGKKSASDEESGINQVSEKGVELSSLPASQESKNKEVTPFTSSQTVITNGHIVLAPGSSGVVHAAHLTVGSLINQSDEGSAINSIKLGSSPPLPHSVNAVEKPSIDFGTVDTHGQLTSSSSNSSTAGTQAPSPGVYFSASDPVLVPSHDSRFPGVVGAIKHEAGSQRTPAEQISLVPSEEKAIAAVSEVGSSSAQGIILVKSLVVASSIHGGSSTIRPSPNYSSRLQQLIGPQKAGPSKEWKPKPPNPIPAQGSGTTGSAEVPTIAEGNTQSHQVLSALDSKDGNSNPHKKLEELHNSDGQHVIPNHLHIHEAEKIHFCFGSFDATFGFSTGHNNIPENDRNPAPLSETSESVEEEAKQSSSNLTALERTGEGDYPDYPQSPRHVPENLLTGEGDVSSTIAPEYSESKKETSLLPVLNGHQYSMIHTSPSYSFDFMSPMVSSQIAPFESSESQACDVSRLPSFVVPQPFDPASCYGQFYRPGTDSDGHISPFQSPGVAVNYNGNVAVLTPQTFQSVQEGGNSVVLSLAGPTLLTQAAGVMHSSIPVAQQPLPVFRHPNGMPISHYPPNYIPYGHYFSPFYVPAQFLSNGGFPQQPQAGSVCPAPPGPTAKYSLPQYHAATNTANSTHIGVASSYGPYGSTPAGYNPSSTSTAGNSTSNEDLNTPQFKESNVYIAGQQSEGSSVWFTAPGRDISGLQVSSFYNIPSQGQVTFTPTQSGHDTFAGLYHPALAVSAATVHTLIQQSQPMAAPVDIMGPTASVYQQPQHTQINWPSNY